MNSTAVLVKRFSWMMSIGIVLAFALSLFVSDVGAQTCTTNADCGFQQVCQDVDGALKCVTTFGVNSVGNGLEGTLGNKSLIGTITSLINVALGLLGVIAVVIILIGGFKWMTAGGNEDKVGEARKMIFAGIIGLAIILSAWAIAKFVITSLSQATGSGNV